jgi:prepilin-type N-terminal cleavage/methylation domain-containing protein
MFTSKLSTSKLSKGFTLIELLVVIAIIGILSSVVLASMNSARKKSRDSRRQQDLKSYATALELAFDKAGSYPVSATAARVVPASGTSVLQSLVTDGFISSALQDDPGAPSSLSSAEPRYWYVTDATGSTFCMGTTMESGAPSPADTCSATQGSAITSASAGANYKVGP